ncbi:MAG: prepilin-type N-terminal cleavage/methylation domain-containing protein [Verrucomicrobiales bacterium]|jgi:prepilin-type N-terminal cleavage/methylation domain-containing protein|nr:prepilin-type N-terminal cleavage/methylation domain-containing protein [Verrucomicrobiales bacterium]
MTHADRQRGFTLVEMMTASAILGVLVVVLATMMNNVSKIWVTSRDKITSLQNGRAILEFMSRDLQRIAAPKISFGVPAAQNASFPAYSLAFIQFLQDAGTASGGLQDWLPDSQTAVPNSSNIFGQVYGENTPRGNLWIFGYYLAEDDNQTRWLYRLAVSPSDANNPANANPDYRLFASGSGAQPGNDPSGNAWLGGAAMFNPNKYAFPLGENIMAFYVVCLDYHRQPIPWLSQANPAAAPLKFNSAAAFVMPQISGTAAADQAFVYLQSTGAGVPVRPAHKLPAALRISILTADKKSLKRLAAQSQSLPAPPDLSDYRAGHKLDYDLVAIRAYQKTLTEAPYNLGGVLLFTLNINLNQGGP